MICHNVYFTLKETSDEAIRSFLSACEEYLTNHLGVTFFACGVLEPERPKDHPDDDDGHREGSEGDEVREHGWAVTPRKVLKTYPKRFPSAKVAAP